MGPKKKLSKKEKARLEAEQAELMRIAMEKERLKKLEEERQRKQIEREQAKKRQQEEILENRIRHQQLKNSMRYFNSIKETINGIKTVSKGKCDWEKFMRCNGLPNANSPSDLRKYLHQWRRDIKIRNRESRNWLLHTNERTLLTQDADVADLTRAMLRNQQEKIGDVYARRIKEVMGILTELDESVTNTNTPAHIIKDLNELKTEIRVFLNEHLDEFTYKLMSQIERDMEIDRPGVYKHIYKSEVFKSHIWTFSKDSNSAMNAKGRVVDQTQHTDVFFSSIEMQINLPPSVNLQDSVLRGLWLNFDYLSDYCPSYFLKKNLPQNIDILMQMKKEWQKRKEILQNMLNDCDKQSPLSGLGALDESPSAAEQKKMQNFDVDKIYAEYEDKLMKERKRAIGPEAFKMLPTDVNLRKYRIIGGVYCIDFIETPEQDKRLNAKSFIRTTTSKDTLVHKTFFQSYKPPPAPLPGVRRLPEEIEAEMRMIEAALDKLALVTLQLSDSVIWFEPPIACRWETQSEALESDLTQGIKIAKSPTPPLPADVVSLSTTTNVSPSKITPRFSGQIDKGHFQKRIDLPVREIVDFDMFAIPSDIDLYGLLKQFVVPRLPHGFQLQLETKAGVKFIRKKKRKQKKFLYVAKYKNTFSQSTKLTEIDGADAEMNRLSYQTISKECINLDEPNECFPIVKIKRLCKFSNLKSGGSDTYEAEEENVKDKEKQEEEADKVEEEVGETLKSNVDESKVKEIATKNVKKSYMFSQLLYDLDQLNELQMPLLEDAINDISENLSISTTDSQNEPDRDGDEKSKFVLPTSITPIKFCNMLSSKNETEQYSGETMKTFDDEFSDSSSELDDNDYDDDELEKDELNLTAQNEDNQNIDVAVDAVIEILSGTDAKISNAVALTHGKWSTRDVHDTKFNEDKLSIQFRTGRFGIFGFALNRYSNMPYQTWEIKPDFKSPNTILFSFTASIISIDITITSEGFCVTNFQGGTTEAINNIIGKTLLLSELKATLIASAVDIFPDEDAFCYTEGSCEKNYVMEMHLYACMSTLSLSHNFNWSRWNLLAGSRTAVLLVRELIEGKKLPNYSTLLVTPLKTAIIDCTEVSASFNAVGIPGMQFYADLYQLSQVHALPTSLEKQLNMNPVLRDNVAQILMAVRPLSFC